MPRWKLFQTTGSDESESSKAAIRQGTRGAVLTGLNGLNDAHVVRMDLRFDAKFRKYRVFILLLNHSCAICRQFPSEK